VTSQIRVEIAMKNQSEKILLGKSEDTAISIQQTQRPWALDVDAFTIPTDLSGSLTGGLGDALEKALDGELWSLFKNLAEAALKEHSGYSPERPLRLDVPDEIRKAGIAPVAFIATAFHPKADYPFAAAAATAVAQMAATTGLKRVAISFLGSGKGGLDSVKVGLAMADRLLKAGPYGDLEEIILTTTNPKSVQAVSAYADSLRATDATVKTGPDSGSDGGKASESINAPHSGRPMLKTGDMGEAVKQLQERLVFLETGLSAADVSGVFDPKTESALRAFQQKWNLAADGIAGPGTWDALMRAAKPTPPGALFDYRDFLIEKALHNDQWAQVDLLDYGLYAKAITEIIKEEDKKTQPPLTIAILAPWGQGKTTLMRYVQRAFASDRPLTGLDTTNTGVLTVKKLLSTGDHQPKLAGSIAYPTVWFNPWKYQSSDQIYAGMAHAIITQLVAYLKPAAREKFWLHLNLKRIDINAIRSKIHQAIITQFASKLSAGIIVGTLLLFSLPLIAAYLLLQQNIAAPSSAVWIKSVSALASFFGLCGPSIKGYLKSQSDVLNEQLKDTFQDVVTSPDYEKKIGLFHDVEADLERVFELLVEKSKPAVIFIDDLDRCSPDKVVEVIEAMNLIINSDFSTKCYFIIGMDAQMVAAALDEKYESMVGKFREEENKYGSIGWYFLDKFIQMPIILPILSPEKKEHLLRGLFERSVSPQAGRDDEAVSAEDRQVIQNYFQSKKSQASREKLEVRIKTKPEIKKEFIKQSIEEVKEDSPVIIEQLKSFAPYLGTSPRSIKRFANMFRFYNIYQELRSFEGLPYAKPDALAKWLVLNLRYPQLVRFLQWEREDKIVNSRVPSEKAAVLDGLIERFVEANGAKIDQKLSNAWKAEIEMLELESFDWLQEHDLLKLLVEFNREDGRLESAVACNVW
jgi:peptidoglycan hydrolase-like protein with peptidoglycan-binding domain